MTTPPDTDRCTTSNKVYRCTRRVGHMGDCDFAALRPTPPNNTPATDGWHRAPDGWCCTHPDHGDDTVQAMWSDGDTGGRCAEHWDTPGADSVDVEALVAKIRRVIEKQLTTEPRKTGADLISQTAWIDSQIEVAVEDYGTAMYERGKADRGAEWVSTLERVRLVARRDGLSRADILETLCDLELAHNGEQRCVT